MSEQEQEQQQEQPAAPAPAPDRFNAKQLRKWLNIAVLMAGVVLAGLALYEGWNDGE